MGGSLGIPVIDFGVFEEGERASFTKKLKTLMLKEFELYSKKVELVSIVVKKLKSKQISEKILRVRNKYTNNAIMGGKKNGPHDLEVFELCEKIWMDQNQSINNKERGIIKQEAVVKENSKFITIANDYLSKIMAIGGSVWIPGIDLGVFKEGKKAYFAKKLKTLMLKEFELFSEKVELVSIVVKELKSK
ncbi:hypothetical protein LguiB_009603 [Lonicera macranthoides]